VHDAVLDLIGMYLDVPAIERSMIEPAQVRLAVGGAARCVEKATGCRD
jgi:hypothetical protein